MNEYFFSLINEYFIFCLLSSKNGLIRISPIELFHFSFVLSRDSFANGGSNVDTNVETQELLALS
jgi:hypothetical protein